MLTATEAYGRSPLLVLQMQADQLGADTVEITNSYGPTSKSIDGRAYRCAGVSGGGSFGKWKLRAGRGLAIGIESSASVPDSKGKPYHPTLVIACAGDSLSGGLLVSGAASGNVRVSFDATPPTTVSLQRISAGSLVVPAVDRLIEHLRSHDKMSLEVNRSEGPLVLDFDIRGFAEAVKPVLGACHIPGGTGTVSVSEGSSFRVALEYDPQENVTAAASGTRPLRIAPLLDTRNVPFRDQIGENRESETRPIQIFAAESFKPSKSSAPVPTENPVADFATSVFRSCLSEWNVPMSPTAELLLRGRIEILRVIEENRYHGTAAVRFLLESSGTVLWEGVAKGEGSTYGHSLSQENYSITVSDALRATYANLLSNTEFQNAWRGAASAVARTDPETKGRADLKARVLRMMGEGISSDVIAAWLKSVKVSPPLSDEEILDWKRSGISQEIIKAALPEAKAKD
jgi:hypothetical protein